MCIEITSSIFHLDDGTLKTREDVKVRVQSVDLYRR